MDLETQALLGKIRHQLGTALDGFTFAPSAEMIRHRFMDRMTEIVGEQVRQLTKEHLRVEQTGDSIVIEIERPLMQVIRSVYGEDLMAAFAPDSIVKLPGWRNPAGQCPRIKIEEEETIKIETPKPVEAVEAPVRYKGRPRSKQIWD